MENDLPISCDPPTRQEIRAAILKTKNGKAAGPDGIPSETLKADNSRDNSRDVTATVQEDLGR